MSETTKKKDDCVLVLRTCKADMTSPSPEAKGFKWPIKGMVVAKDWNPKPECGGGLHGLLWGEGDGSFLCWDKDAKWLVVRVLALKIIDIDRKVKFPRGEVVHVGSQKSATDYLLANGASGKAVVGSTVTGGYASTVMGGYASTVMGGEKSILELPWWDSDNSRYRIEIAYTGENGIKPNTKYYLNKDHKFEEVQ